MYACKTRAVISGLEYAEVENSHSCLLYKTINLGISEKSKKSGFLFGSLINYLFSSWFAIFWSLRGFIYVYFLPFRLTYSMFAYKCEKL